MQKPTRKKIGFAVGAASLCLTGVAVTGVATGLAANAAEETPTARELLEACGTQTDTCIFHPEGPPVPTDGQVHKVPGTERRNCTSSLQKHIVKWSETDTEENKVGVKVTAEATFAEVYKVAIETSYEHTWSHARTVGRDEHIDVKPGHTGYLQRVAKMQTVKGRYEMRFPDRFYGHYIWYLPYESTGPVAEGDGDLEVKEEPIDCANNQ